MTSSLFAYAILYHPRALPVHSISECCFPDFPKLFVLSTFFFWQLHFLLLTVWRSLQLFPKNHALFGPHFRLMTNTEPIPGRLCFYNRNKPIGAPVERCPRNWRIQRHIPNLQLGTVKAAVPSHREGVRFNPRAVHRDLWGTKWRRFRLLSIYFNIPLSVLVPPVRVLAATGTIVLLKAKMPRNSYPTPMIGNKY